MATKAVAFNVEDLRRDIKSAGLTQEKVAKLVGMTQRGISGLLIRGTAPQATIMALEAAMQRPAGYYTRKEEPAAEAPACDEKLDAILSEIKSLKTVMCRLLAIWEAQ